ncbi:transposase [Brucella intermedia]|uniref:transposase n=1 Tax=Brucella intermedia TaxID=94625 RepID=UPI0023601A46|nr:transposase [Brucella intermedia]
MCNRHKKGTQETEALGRSRGGFTTKLHARCDAKGRPLGFVLTPGQTHDTQGLRAVIPDDLRSDRGVPRRQGL